MTEPDIYKSERLDLSALELPTPAAHEDSITTLMARVNASRSMASQLRFRRVLLAAAAILVAVAIGSWNLNGVERPAANGDYLLREWLDAGHVPTNGELLLAYHGYAP